MVSPATIAATIARACSSEYAWTVNSGFGGLAGDRPKEREGFRVAHLACSGVLGGGAVLVSRFSHQRPLQ